MRDLLSKTPGGPLDSSNLDIAKLIKNGSVGVIPTDTVYGLVASAHNIDAVKRLMALKNRENKPGTVIAANINQLVSLGIKKRNLQAAEKFWPGAISAVVTSDASLEYLHPGLSTIAVRIPNDPIVLKLLTVTGPLLTTSANRSGEPTATSIQAAKEIFGDSIDFYLDGGDLADRLPSTIIRITDNSIELLRPGAVSINTKV